MPGILPQGGLGLPPGAMASLHQLHAQIDERRRRKLLTSIEDARAHLADGRNWLGMEESDWEPFMQILHQKEAEAQVAPTRIFDPREADAQRAFATMLPDLRRPGSGVTPDSVIAVMRAAYYGEDRAFDRWSMKLWMTRQMQGAAQALKQTEQKTKQGGVAEALEAPVSIPVTPPEEREGTALPEAVAGVSEALAEMSGVAPAPQPAAAPALQSVAAPAPAPQLAATPSGPPLADDFWRGEMSGLVPPAVPDEVALRQLIEDRLTSYRKIRRGPAVAPVQEMAQEDSLIQAYGDLDILITRKELRRENAPTVEDFNTAFTGAATLARTDQLDDVSLRGLAALSLRVQGKEPTLETVRPEMDRLRDVLDVKARADNRTQTIGTALAALQMVMGRVDIASMPEYDGMTHEEVWNETALPIVQAALAQAGEDPAISVDELKAIAPFGAAWAQAKRSLAGQERAERQEYRADVGLVLRKRTAQLAEAAAGRAEEANIRAREAHEAAMQAYGDAAGGAPITAAQAAMAIKHITQYFAATRSVPAKKYGEERGSIEPLTGQYWRDLTREEKNEAALVARWWYDRLEASPYMPAGLHKPTVVYSPMTDEEAARAAGLVE